MLELSLISFQSRRLNYKARSIDPIITKIPIPPPTIVGQFVPVSGTAKGVVCTLGVADDVAVAVAVGVADALAVPVALIVAVAVGVGDDDEHKVRSVVQDAPSDGQQ